MQATKVALLVALVAGTAVAVLPFVRREPARPGAEPVVAPSEAALVGDPGGEEPEGAMLAGTPAPRRTALAEADPPPAAPAEAPEEAAPGPARVRARVVDVAGRPLSGARASCERGGATAAESDAAGLLVLEVQEPRSFDRDFGAEVVVRHAGHAARLVRTRLVRGTTFDLGDVALADAGTVAGRVLVDGRPVAGATVLATGIDEERRDPEELRRSGPGTDPATPRATSTSDGAFLLPDVEVGLRRLWAHAPGHGWAASEVLELAPGELVPGVEIELLPLHASDEIAGVVLEPDGTPVPGARVDAWGLSARASSYVVAETDEAGRFRLVLEHRVPHDLTADDPEHRFASALVLGVEPGRDDLTIRLPERRLLRIEVHDPDWEPVVGARARATCDLPASESLLASAVSQEPGLLELLLPDVPFELEVAARGYAPHRTGELDPASLGPDLEVDLEPMAGVHGRVLDDRGRPLAGVRVGLHECTWEGMLIQVDGLRSLVVPRTADETTSDAEGRFVLYPEEARACVVRLEKDGFAPDVTEPFDVDPRQRTELERTLGRGGAIEGSVLLPPGEDPAGRVVVLDRADGQPRTVRVDADGAFRAERLTPGPWRLELREQDLEYRISYGGSDRELEPIRFDCEVVEGRTTRHDLDLRGEAACVLAGRVDVGPSASAAGFTASLEDARRDFVTPEVVATVPVAADGTFRLAAREAGRTTLVVRSPGGAGSLTCREELVLAPGETAWSWSFAPAELLLLDVPDEGGVERFLQLSFPTGGRGGEEGGGEGEGRSVRLRVVGTGAVLLPLVPAGRCVVERFAPEGPDRRWPGFETVREVELRPGERTEVSVR